MFFYVSKLLWPLTQPSNVLFLLLLLGSIALGLGRRKLARAVLYGVTLILIPIAVLPVGEWMLTPLENRFPAPVAPPDRVDGVVVLGGGVDLPVAASRHTPALRETAERFTTLIELGRRYPDARLVFTGGVDWLSGVPLSEAEVMRDFYRRQGFDTARILFEDRARNTHENALLSRQLATPGAAERWLLVTSAAHMPRAIGVFRQAGWPVLAYPVDYRTSGRFDLWVGLDAAQRLREFDDATKAWIGLVAYWLSGRSSALFPAPSSGEALNAP
jgi:uncharacterized SAM-binding protein YcdF (DUF218 family)